MPSVVFKDSFIVDLQKAYNYLELQENDLGEKLLQVLSDYVSVIESNPFLFKSGYRQVRQAWLKPFQFVLRYRVYTNQVVIIQLFHSKRHPQKRSFK